MPMEVSLIDKRRVFKTKLYTTTNLQKSVSMEYAGGQYYAEAVEDHHNGSV